MAGFGDELLILRGPTGVVDQSVNGNDGTYVGGMGTVANSAEGGVSAFDFDGTDDFLSLSSFGFGTATAFSFGVWIKTSASGSLLTNWDIINNPGYSLEIRGGGFNYLSFGFYSANGGSARRIVGTTILTDNAWHLVGMSYDGTNSATGISLYVDGSLESMTTLSDTSPGTIVDSHLRAGYRTTSSPSAYTGLMDDVRVFDRVVTTAEMTDWYTVGRGYNAPTAPSKFSVNTKEPVAAWCPSRDKTGWKSGTLTDLSGNGNNGTLTNMDPDTDWVSSDGKGALDFDGVDDYVNVSTLPLSAFNCCVSVWFRTTSNGVGRYIYGQGSDNLLGPILGLNWTGSDTLRATARDDSGNLSFSETSLPNDGHWHHAIAQFSTEGTKLYVDGSLADSDSTSLGGVTFSEGGIGIWRQSDQRNFLGALDDLRIFNQALTQSDINYLYNNGKGRGRIYVPEPKFHPLASSVRVINSHRFGGSGPGFGNELLILRGPTGIVDQSGNGNDGTYAGGMGVAADTELNGVSAFQFDGVNDRITLPSVVYTDEFGIGGFYKITASTTEQLWSKKTSVSSESIQFFKLGSALTFRVYSAAGVWTGRTTGAILTDGWHHLFATYTTNDGPRIFLDGVRVDNADNNNGSFTIFNDLAIGSEIGSQNSGAAFFAGLADDLRLGYLTASQIADWYAEGRGYDA